ncbi:helix-turn-helix domain-containing protein [Nonomuraea sp. CA-143628]|uniref:helix-turn-helix domain-containing protein n=1 Tax=Nonomuraea sp. CA-143628 TaxID=3239997 RepID=UPI003D8A2573
MSAWRPLADSLSPEMRHLTRELRVMKDRTSLSLGQLAKKTACSKSAWSRYLNGQALAPYAVVAALGELADADQARLHALWELAAESGGRAGEGAYTATGDGPGVDEEDDEGEDDAESTMPFRVVRDSSPTRRWLAILAIGVVVVAIGLVVAVLTGAISRPVASPTGPRTPTPAGSCQASDCTGRTAEPLGCARDAVVTAYVQVDYARLELRYSAVCRAAWAVLTGARRYDRVNVTGDAGAEAKGKDRAGSAAATPMVAAAGPEVGYACAELTSGARKCVAARR